MFEITISFIGSTVEESIKYENKYLKESEKFVDTAPLDKEIIVKINPMKSKIGTINTNF
tara:strand:+ start:1044 stop:1220 length:177 start_codon:yes stop_codon:yes gene_type:complete